MKLLNSIIFTLASFFLCLWLYLFFSRKLRNIVLYPLETAETLGYIKTLLVISVCLFLLVLFSLLYKLWRSRKKSSNSKITLWLNKYNRFINKINIFYKAYVMLFDFLGLDYTGYLIKFSKLVLTFTKKQTLGILFAFVVLPRIIILLVFSSEIYLGQLHYFFYCLFLLIIPMIFRIMIFMLTDLGPRLFPEFDKLVIKTPERHKIVRNGRAEELDIIALSFTEEVADLNFDRFARNIYFPLKHIGPHMRDNVLPLYINILQYTVLIYFFTISAGLIYILVCNI